MNNKHNLLKRHCEKCVNMDCANAEKKDELKLAPPWITYFSELKALFGQDPEIHITIDDSADDNNPSIKILVDAQEKYEALNKLLPASRWFGNVEANIYIIPANKECETPLYKVYEAAFKGNPVMDEMLSFDTPLTGKISYLMFKKEVVQFFNDDMQDPNGLKSTLYQDIAKEVFEDQRGVFFCTSK